MIQAGAATNTITPPVGTSLAGYFTERISTSVHDELLARALVLSNGAQTVAIVSCDLLWLSCGQVARVRAIASESTGIPEGQILVACTHTHTGPEAIPGNITSVNEAYLEQLPERIAQAVSEAHRNMRPATLRLGEEQDRSVAFYRRFRMKSGGEVFNPGFLNPEILGPAGDIDPQVNLLRVDDESGEPLAILANYALHPDVKTGTEISADWPGELCQILSESYDSHPVVLFGNGTCGNINHFDVSKPGPQGGWSKVEQIARTLAGKMLAASENAQETSEEIQVRFKIIDIPYHPLTPELAARAQITRLKDNPNIFEKLQAERIESYQLDGKAAPVEIQAIRIGDTALVGIPGEYFVEWGKEIKHWSPFKQTFIIELANGCYGYIPTLQAYYRGGYEAMPILSVHLAPEAGLRMADAAIELLQELAE